MVVIQGFQLHGYCWMVLPLSWKIPMKNHLARTLTIEQESSSSQMQYSKQCTSVQDAVYAISWRHLRLKSNQDVHASVNALASSVTNSGDSIMIMTLSTLMRGISRFSTGIKLRCSMLKLQQHNKMVTKISESINLRTKTDSFTHSPVWEEMPKGCTRR